jgi:hypothetical protein
MLLVCFVVGFNWLYSFAYSIEPLREVMLSFLTAGRITHCDVI